MDTICEFCKNTFSNKYILKNHQKRADYCLKIQNKKKEKVKIYQCEGCNKQIKKKENYVNHINKCVKIVEKSYIDKLNNKDIDIDKLKIYYDKKIEKSQETIKKIRKKHTKEIKELKEEYEDKIDKLQDRLQELAKEAINRPSQVVKTTNNTTTNNVLNLTPFDLENEDFKENIEKNYDMKYLVQGVRGVAQFTKDKLLTDEDGNSRYICVDPARQIFKYVDKNGETRRDVKASKLTKKVTPDIVNQANKLVGKERENKENYQSTIDELTNTYFSIKDLYKNPGKLGNELSKIITE